VIEQFDANIVLYLNGILRNHYLLTRIAQGLTDNALARGAPVFIPLLVIWFSCNNIENRGRVLTGLLGAFVATFASVVVQRSLHLGVRPFLNPKLHLYLLNGEFADGWFHANSFPSDTAALFFALSTVVFLEWRFAGIIAYAWSFLADGICRMALGFHSPTDIVAGIILGVGTVYVFSRMRFMSAFAQSVLKRSNSRLAWVHALLILFIADAYNLFPALRGMFQFLHILPGQH
jgi:membrane-associated phospholipid phosphatase